MNRTRSCGTNPSRLWNHSMQPERQIHHLHDLVQKIEGSLNQKEFALVDFLNIDGSFDNASFGSMDAASMGLF
jgi:hypothetical protein